MAKSDAKTMMTQRENPNGQLIGVKTKAKIRVDAMNAISMARAGTQDKAMEAFVGRA
jgi:hypothetical protein